MSRFDSELTPITERELLAVTRGHIDHSTVLFQEPSSEAGVFVYGPGPMIYGHSRSNNGLPGLTSDTRYGWSKDLLGRNIADSLYRASYKDGNIEFVPEDRETPPLLTHPSRTFLVNTSRFNGLTVVGEDGFLRRKSQLGSDWLQSVQIDGHRVEVDAEIGAELMLLQLVTRQLSSRDFPGYSFDQAAHLRSFIVVDPEAADLVGRRFIKQ